MEFELAFSGLVGLAILVFSLYTFLSDPKPQTKDKNVEGLQALLDALKALQQQTADAAAILADEKKKSYDEGFAAGVASVPVPPVSDKIYSQEEMDKAIADAISPLNEKIAALQAEVDGIQGKIDAAVSAAIAALKADLKAKYAEMQVIENAAETGFGALLEGEVVVPVDPPVAQ